MKPNSDPDSSEAKEAARHAEHVVALAKKLANGERPGVLATVDEAGRPHLRWMATLSLNDFPLLYTITSPLSRKLAHIEKHPEVSWMFSNEDASIIINISGRARIETEFSTMNRVWRMLEDKSKAYFLNISHDGPGFAVICTEIEDIECTMPKYDFRFLAQGKEIKGDPEQENP